MKSFLLLPSAVASLSATSCGVTTGGQHACALDLNGHATCWGLDDKNQLRHHQRGERWLEICTGETHTCALRMQEGQSVKCWGDNTFTQLDIPADIAAASDWRHISCGYRHTCLVSESGALKCFGYDLDEDGGPAGQVSATPLGGNFASVSAGRSHTCGLYTNGTGSCWGDNDDSLECNLPATQKVSTKPILRFASLAAGNDFTCGVTVAAGTTAGTLNKELMCWGYNLDEDGEASGQIDVPTSLLPAGYRFDDVDTGGSHTCARLVRSSNEGVVTPFAAGSVDLSGEVRCWGDNDDANEATPPVGVSLESIALGNDTSCGTAVGTGVPVCWGLNNHRQAEVPFNAVRGCFGFDT